MVNYCVVQGYNNLHRRYGETKRDPARISERAGETPVMPAAFRIGDSKPLRVDASLPCVQSTLRFS